MPVCNSRLETFGDKVVLVVEVEGNKSTIHALTVDADKPEYFVRRGATTFPARPEELQAIARSQQTTEPGSWRGLLG
jgi:predicted HTH transcriptional regulator